MNGNTEKDIALIKQDIGYIKESVGSINRSIQLNYTPISDFNALKSRVDNAHRILAYLAILIAAGLIAAIMRLVLK